MKKILFTLALTLLTSLSLSAQLSPYYPWGERPEGFITQGMRMYSLSASFVQGLGFNKRPIPSVELEQSTGFTLGYTTVFAQVGRVAISSESEATYRTLTELFDNSTLKRASISGLTGLGFYYNIGKNTAIYAKGLLGLGTGYAAQSSQASFADLFSLEARAGIQLGLGQSFSAFGDVGYGKDFFRVGLSFRH